MPAHSRRGPLRPQQFFAPATQGQPLNTGVAGVTFQVVALAANATESFLATAAERFAVAALAASGTNILAITGTGAVTFKVAGLASNPPAVLAEDEPHRRPYAPRPQLPPPGPPRIPFHVQIEPTIRELPLKPEPVTVTIDNRVAIVALFATGVLDETQLAALLAA